MRAGHAAATSAHWTRAREGRWLAGIARQHQLLCAGSLGMESRASLDILRQKEGHRLPVAADGDLLVWLIDEMLEVGRAIQLEQQG